MPKLFVASGIFYPEPGGPATYLRAILPALQSMGWELRVLTFGEPDDEPFPYPIQRIPRETYPLRIAKYGLAARRHLAWADLVYAQTIDLPLWGGRGAPRVIKIVGDQAWERCVRKRWIPPDMTVDAFQRYRGELARPLAKAIANAASSQHGCRDRAQPISQRHGDRLGHPAGQDSRYL